MKRTKPKLIERQRFERWVSHKRIWLDLGWIKDHYWSVTTQVTWQAWQASKRVKR